MATTPAIEMSCPLAGGSWPANKSTGAGTPEYLTSAECVLLPPLFAPAAGDSSKRGGEQSKTPVRRGLVGVTDIFLPAVRCRFGVMD